MLIWTISPFSATSIRRQQVQVTDQVFNPYFTGNVSATKEIATQVFLTMGMKVNAGYKSEENSNTINLPLLLLLFIITFLGATVGLITGIYGYLVSICVSLLFSLIKSALGYYAIIKTKTIKEWNMPN